MFKSGPNYTKLKTNLRLVINRLKLLEKKKTEIALKSRKEIADYITAGKEDRARIRVEHIIREDYLVEAMELLEMYCDLLLARFGLIQTQKELDPGLEESIASIIWATPRLQADVQELKAVTDEFTAKYGKEFGMACRSNALNNVSEKVMHKLSVQAPPKTLVERYMDEIAKSYNVPFVPDASVMSHDEILLAENMLIDFGNEDRKGGGGGSGPSGGMGALQPVPSASSAPYPANNVSYPPQQPYPAGKVPPALPTSPPAGPPSMSPPPAYNTPGYPEPNGAQAPYPSQDQLYDNNVKPAMPPNPGFNIPDLPAVPTNTLPDLGNTVGSGSAGGEDVDFDDLTKRFEALKKKK
ncbi:IST1 homolog isoform X2 [Haliotis asinina]|uniref:IST1 homolog isoform X2 n=1 Tax=Haliotis asinina TaxID=109174 RepID=UPI0035318661